MDIPHLIPTERSGRQQLAGAKSTTGKQHCCCKDTEHGCVLLPAGSVMGTTFGQVTSHQSISLKRLTLLAECSKLVWLARRNRDGPGAAELNAPLHVSGAVAETSLENQVYAVVWQNCRRYSKVRLTRPCHHRAAATVHGNILRTESPPLVC